MIPDRSTFLAMMAKSSIDAELIVVSNFGWAPAERPLIWLNHILILRIEEILIHYRAAMMAKGLGIR